MEWVSPRRKRGLGKCGGGPLRVGRGALGFSLFSAVVFLALVIGVGGSVTYDVHCDEIVRHARAAARFHNQGDFKAAEDEHQLAFAAFEKAVALNPDDPQAFANMAVYSFNSQRFDDAIEYWKQVQQRLDPDDQGMHAMVQGKLRECKYGDISVKRDRVYDGGQGNISEALRLAEDQLALLSSPETHRDVATMLLMRSEVDPSAQERALSHYQQAADTAFKGFVAGARARGWRCAQRDRLYTGWQRRKMPPGTSSTKIESEHSFNGTVRIISEVGTNEALQSYTQGRVWHLSLSSMALFGNDGLIGPAPSSHAGCWLQLGSAGVYVDVLANVQAHTVWDEHNAARVHDAHHGRFPNAGMQRLDQLHRLESAATVISFAVRSYYHWVTEGLPRLLLSLQHVPQTAPLLVPQDDTNQQFISQFIALLAPSAAGRIVPYQTRGAPNDARVLVDRLHLIDWQRTDDGTSMQTHALPPRSLLRLVREACVGGTDVVTALQEGVRKTPHLPLIVVASRKTERMRILEDEDALVSDIQSTLEGRAEVVVFRGDQFSTKKTIALFSQATAVVGVHGGALANTVFCPEGAAVFELGFNTTHTQHYRHLSLALDLHYTLTLLQPDERGVGRKNVVLPTAARASLLDAVKEFVSTAPPKHEEL